MLEIALGDTKAAEVEMPNTLAADVPFPANGRDDVRTVRGIARTRKEPESTTERKSSPLGDTRLAAPSGARNRAAVPIPSVYPLAPLALPAIVRTVQTH